MSTAAKVLKQEQQLASAIAKVFRNPAFENMVDELLSNIRVEEHSLFLAREVFKEVGISTAYDALLDDAFEDERVEAMLAAQQPKAAEAVKKLRAEFGSLPVDGLKAFRLLIDSAIREKEG